MKTDIQIAQEAQMLPIREVAERAGIAEEDLEFYGKYKAKLSEEFWDRIKDNPDGKLVLVTAINPTPAGEGKTTTSVGLGQAMQKLNQKAVIALREPSLGPCLGSKAVPPRRRICAGCSDGRSESAFYRRFPCDHFCQQSACSNAGQSYPAGKCTADRSSPGCMETLAWI